MPKTNLDGVEMASKDSFDPIPPGKYHVKVIEAELKISSAGDEYINYKMEIFEGQYHGRTVYDSVFFTDKSKSRLALVASRLLGIKPIGDLDIEPEMFLRKTCWIEVVQDSYFKDGVEKKKNIVTFAGYLSDKEEDSQEGETEESQVRPDDDLPF